MQWIELTATIFGLLCVLLTIRRSIWCWPTGLVQVLLFIIVFYDAKLYSDLILHVIYVGMQLYGWHCWTHPSANQAKLGVFSLPPSHLARWILVAMVGTLVWGFSMKTWTDASLPYADAFTTVTSLIAQYLLARRYVQNWGFWIVVDVVAIGVYFAKDLHATATLYAVFLILATVGWMSWTRELQNQTITEAAV